MIVILWMIDINDCDLDTIYAERLHTEYVCSKADTM
jgi:hypothetical protein